MIEINNLTKQKIRQDFVKKIAREVLKQEAIKKDLSIVFASQQKIKSLNKKYRGKNTATDVLSFGSGLDEVVICPEIVKKNAKKLKLDYNEELTRVLIHGILHILGYEHEKSDKEAEKMRNKEKYYLSKF